MGFRFRKSIKLAPGLRLNVSKKGLGLSAGVKGVHVSTGPSGQRMTTSLPGTGISHSTKLGIKTTKKSGNAKASIPQTASKIPMKHSPYLIGGVRAFFGVTTLILGFFSFSMLKESSDAWISGLIFLGIGFLLLIPWWRSLLFKIREIYTRNDRLQENNDHPQSIRFEQELASIPTCVNCGKSGISLKLTHLNTCLACYPVMRLNLESNYRVYQESYDIASTTENPETLNSRMELVKEKLLFFDELEKKGINCLQPSASKLLEIHRNETDELYVDCFKKKFEKLANSLSDLTTKRGQLFRINDFIHSIAQNKSKLITPESLNEVDEKAKELLEVYSRQE